MTANRVLRLLLLLGWLGSLVAADRPPMAAEPSAAGVDFEGRWTTGSWTSQSNGHTGRLCAKIVRRNASHYNCTFCGTFCKIVPFRYTVTLHVSGSENGRVHFWAKKKLPLCFGTFTCRGWATSNVFCAGFASQDDRGTFVMRR